MGSRTRVVKIGQNVRQPAQCFHTPDCCDICNWDAEHGNLSIDEAFHHYGNYSFIHLGMQQQQQLSLMEDGHTIKISQKRMQYIHVHVYKEVLHSIPHEMVEKHTVKLYIHVYAYSLDIQYFYKNVFCSVEFTIVPLVFGRVRLYCKHCNDHIT